jgi:hypothetical protein
MKPFALMVSWIVIQTECAEHLRSRAVSRRFSVERQLLRTGTLDGVVLISNSFLVHCPAESGLIVAGSLFKPREIEDPVVAVIAELCCAYALRAAI